jgi:hypothetical protein
MTAPLLPELAPAPAPVPARPAGILGKFVALALFLSLAASVVMGFLVTPVDGAAKQREYFGEGALPAGFMLDSAVRLPTGDGVVRFTRAEGAAGRASDLVFLEFKSAASAVVQMRSSHDDMGAMPAARLKEWELEKAFDWTALMKRGEIAWGDWRTKLVIERSFKKGGGWSEEARVDLSSPARPLVLCVRWPAEHAADEAELRTLLAAIRLAPAGS